MDLKQIIQRANEEEQARYVEEERQLRAQQEPYLGEASRLSNLMAGERGKKNRSEENLKAYEDASRKIAEIERKILEVRHKADTLERQPLDAEALIERAEAELEQAHRLRRWASYQALHTWNQAFVQDAENAEAEIEQLTKLIERLQLAQEFAAELEDAKQEVPA